MSDVDTVQARDLQKGDVIRVGGPAGPHNVRVVERDTDVDVSGRQEVYLLLSGIEELSPGLGELPTRRGCVHTRWVWAGELMSLVTGDAP